MPKPCSVESCRRGLRVRLLSSSLLRAVSAAPRRLGVQELLLPPRACLRSGQAYKCDWPRSYKRNCDTDYKHFLYSVEQKVSSRFAKKKQNSNKGRVAPERVIQLARAGGVRLRRRAGPDPQVPL